MNNYLYSQENLVLNGSFEAYDTCPEYFNNLGITSIGATGWLVPTFGSSDYFNACSTHEVGVPQNLIGYQNAENGRAYAGMILFDSFQKYREYIATKLSTPLIAGKRYFWCFWVSLADSVDYASNNIGIALTDSYITKNDVNILNIEVYGNSDNVITSSDDWSLISGSFIAKGKEQYLYIGNFFNNSKIKLLQKQTNSLAGPEAYYYIDNVYLGETPCIQQSVEIPNVFTPNNDGVNDYYHLSYRGIYKAQINIFNRWGNLVFTGGINSQWDGKHKGKPCTEGVYFIVINYFDYTSNKKIKKTGFIHLIR